MSSESTTVNSAVFTPSVTHNSHNQNHNSDLILGIEGFTYADLYDPHRLKDLSDLFFSQVQHHDAALYTRWMDYKRTKGTGLTDIQISQLLVDLSPLVGAFVAKLFDVNGEREAQMKLAERDKAVFDFKKEFVIRRAVKKCANLAGCEQVAPIKDLVAVGEILTSIVYKDLFHANDAELANALMVLRLMQIEKNLAEHAPEVQSIQSAVKDTRLGLTTAGADLSTFVKEFMRYTEAWTAARLYDHELFQSIKHWPSFKLPKTMEYGDLVEIIRPEALTPEKFLGPEEYYRRRDGFKLTDGRMNPRQVQSETDYCIFCHERGKDSCSKGIHEKTGEVKKNPLGIELNGCPLNEKISEMHLMRNHGDAIAALALVIIDNPMCPGTGHRICNDCMKGCIYQKQTPVNIPQAETGALTDVLKMRWGFEIYAFLTRWNPLNVQRPYALPYNGMNILVVGLGPAGYTLAHYLLNEGFGVIGIDGLKIEPLAQKDTGYIDESGNWIAPKPLEHWSTIYKALDKRTLDGFGGVAEYGITVRWDKNFLTTIYLTLARRATFSIYGGVRFGGTVTIEDAFDTYSFDHIAIATGAGKPTIVSMKNNLLRGIRKASDFLMALQLTGAAKRETMANLQVQLPAVVIGGGLTAIDTATELMAYYPVQVEKIYDRFHELAATLGEQRIWDFLRSDEDARILKTYLEHAAEIKAERKRAAEVGEEPNFVPMLRRWGGVSIAYRKRLQDSPAYRLNHEEVEKSLEEGIYYYENLSPTEAVPDELGAVKAIVFERQKEIDGKWRGSGEKLEIPAKTVCVAAGTSPNTIYEREHPGTFKMDKWNDFFESFEKNGTPETLHQLDYTKKQKGFFTSYTKGGKFISYYGDNHPLYAGNVVKAMASAKDGYPDVVRVVVGNADQAEAHPFSEWVKFKRKMDDEFMAKVVKVERLTKTIVEVVIHAPAAARHFHPGQFYRLQNFEALAKSINNTLLTMEGLALTGAWVDKEKGLLSLIVLEMGSSSRLVAALKPGEPVIVMGPTGAPTEIPENETILLAGGGLGNAVLFSIAKAMKEKNNRVIYFAGYKNGEDLFKREEIEAATDQVIWSTDSGAEIAANRSQDTHIRANIIEAMIAYETGKLNVEKMFSLKEVDRIIAIGSDRMMAAVKTARRPGGTLHEYMKPEHVAIGSINSPMQCMMKEVCAQCLQRHVDPVTQEEKGFVFSCFNQDQHLDEVDFKHLNERLKANTLQEKISILWLEYLLSKEKVEMV